MSFSLNLLLAETFSKELVDNFLASSIDAGGDLEKKELLHLRASASLRRRRRFALIFGIATKIAAALLVAVLSNYNLLVNTFPLLALS
jgi:hypothetical protein